MEVYSPAEVARQLNIKPATLRKYSIMLENKGYEINRNSQNHRYYTDNDVMTIRRIITGKNSDVTLDEVIHNIVSIHDHNTYTNDTNNAITPYNSDINNVTRDDIDELKEMILLQSKMIQEQGKQTEIQLQHIKELTDRIDQQEQSLLNKQEAEQRKKGFLNWLFGR